MELRSFRIYNYKSYLDSSAIQLGAGFNVFLGKNDAGKTALLEALGQFGSQAHRSLVTQPYRGAPIEMSSTCEVIASVTCADILAALAPLNGRLLFLAPGNVDGSVVSSRVVALVRNGGEVGFLLRDGQIAEAWLPSTGRSPSGARAWELKIPSNIEMIGAPAFVTGWSTHEMLAMQLASLVRQRMYRFSAERLTLSSSSIGGGPVLRPDASNLADVLNLLASSNRHRYDRYNALVRRVFPHIRQVTAPTRAPNNTEILLWPLDPVTERDDLAIPLSASGTGVGQVLAMLYVLVQSAEAAHTISIDEPQTFLHPGAQRVLIDILREFGQNQYLITTHSPTIVSAALDPRLFLVTRQETESEIASLDSGSAEDLRFSLAEVGARLGDVFGADWVLWVEGPTEQEAFPHILEAFRTRPPSGLRMLGIVNTGDLSSRKRRDRRTMLQIYRRLTTADALLPPAVAFVLDREDRTDEELAEMSTETQGGIQFIPRRMFENYLLEPWAIAAVANGIDGFADADGPPITRERIADWIEDNRKRYGGASKPSDAPGSRDWEHVVDGARLLDAIFAEFSANRVRYQKVLHGVQLTRCLLQFDKDRFQELAAVLISCLSQRGITEEPV